MKLKDVLHTLTEYVDRLMREVDPQPPQLMAPERSMTRPRSAPEEQPVTFELRRPWDVGEKKPPARPRSRLLKLKRRLRRPESLREAIILKEILDRPLARRRR